MDEGIRLKLGELLGFDRACDYLDEAAVLSFVEHRMAPSELRRLQTHAAGCPDCAELLADAESFGRLAAGGVQLANERRAFREADRKTRRVLGLDGERKRGPGWISWLVPAFGAVALGLLVVLLRPAAPLMPTVGTMPLAPPPSVRGLSLAEVYERLAPVWERDDMPAALPILEAGVAADPGREDLMLYLGIARLRTGRTAEAVTILEELDALQADVPSEHTRWFLAAAYDRAGRPAEACAALRSVVAVGGSRVEAAREALGRCVGGPGDPT